MFVLPTGLTKPALNLPTGRLQTRLQLLFVGVAHGWNLAQPPRPYDIGFAPLAEVQPAEAR